MGRDCQKQYAGQKQTNKQTNNDWSPTRKQFDLHFFFFFWGTALKFLKLDLEKFFSSYLKR